MASGTQEARSADARLQVADQAGWGRGQARCGVGLAVRSSPEPGKLLSSETKMALGGSAGGRASPGAPCSSWGWEAAWMQVVSKSLPGALKESDFSPETFLFMFFWENANVLENWNKAANLVPGGKRNVRRPTTRRLRGPGREAVSGTRASAATLARTSRASRGLPPAGGSHQVSVHPATSMREQASAPGQALRCSRRESGLSSGERQVRGSGAAGTGQRLGSRAGWQSVGPSGQPRGGTAQSPGCPRGLWHWSLDV